MHRNLSLTAFVYPEGTKMRTAGDCMTSSLEYETLERLKVSKPVDRIDFIANLCRDRRVLDIGCLDETALMKRDTKHWLHGRIAMIAKTVTGIDSSVQIPVEGISTGANSHIFKGDGSNPSREQVNSNDIDIVVAGEFIEHIENPMNFLRAMRQKFPGRDFVMSTPNGVSFANALLGSINREAQHHDHLLTSTYKTLNTLCIRANFASWQIIPYRFFATEMMLQCKGPKRWLISLVEKYVRLIEILFPLRSYGYIVCAKL
jgi:SAM-dependent methyltransferase